MKAPLPQSNYVKDYQKAKNAETGHWIVVISEDWCPGCKTLKRIIEGLIAEGVKLFVTYLPIDDKNAKQIVLQSKHPQKNAIPFWNVWKLDQGQFTQVHSQVGPENAANILRSYTFE